MGVDGSTKASTKCMRKLFNIFIASFLLISCAEKIEPFDASDGLDLLPLSIGNEWNYRIMEISFEISGFDTTMYFIKEQVIDSSQSGGAIVYTVEVSTRSIETEDRQVTSRYVIDKTNITLVRKQGNRSNVLLTYPVSEGKSWDRNAFNTEEPMNVFYSSELPTLSEYDIQSVETDFSMPVQTVWISNYEADIVRQDQRYEVYLPGIGLAEKKSIVLEFCTVNCVSTGQINTGRYYLQELTSYVVD